MNHGGMSVTLEDLLEEIVGEVDDETDKAEIDVFEIADNTYKSYKEPCQIKWL